MKNDNPLNGFNTDTYTYTGFKGGTAPSVCPTLSQAIANPLKLVDYIGCHKILLIIVFGIIGFILYSGVKAKVKAEGGEAGAKGGEVKK
jgi:hypothetical protein